MRSLTKVLLAVLVLVALCAGLIAVLMRSTPPQTDTEVTDAPRSTSTQTNTSEPTQILFGDLHVHTTWSVDAFMWSLPMMGGEGVHPPADACDFARFCSQLDFYSLTDHAESLTPRTWAAEKESIRQCNAVASGGKDQDLFAFAGFEWTQIGTTPDKHYGHKNVIFKHTDDARLPARPIGARGLATRAFSDRMATLRRLNLPLKAFPNHKPYLALGNHIREIGGYPECAAGVHTKELPADCREVVDTPRDLYAKLSEWDLETLVIPHGTTWGFYTPGGYRWDKQIAKAQDDERQRLVEVYSGHGNSEEYRTYAAVELGADGPSCPAPAEDYEPCCWRAGRIIQSRCDDPESEACMARVKKAQQDFVNADTSGYLTVGGTQMEDWGNCGQCTNCFQPSYGHRPGGSVQYMLARGNFDDADAPRHHTLGFIASSDNHSARPGTGYKEFARKKMTEARGALDESWYRAMFGSRGRANKSSRAVRDVDKLPSYKRLWFERQASFFITGGLVAVHAKERSRDAIWQALENRQVYGTSGPRLLLWFDLVNAKDGQRPMGSEVTLAKNPVFKVKAAGAFVQKPGCPESVTQSLGAERQQRLCAGQCYHPDDRRHKITQIEVVRIQRQQRDDESIGALIEDPWKVIPCSDGAEVCTARFEDKGYKELGRPVLYYVRAIQEPTPTINADGLRCDDEQCDPCYGDYRTADDDDCLTDSQARAWSSPIYLSPGRS